MHGSVVCAICANALGKFRQLGQGTQGKKNTKSKRMEKRNALAIHRQERGRPRFRDAVDGLRSPETTRVLRERECLASRKTELAERDGRLEYLTRHRRCCRQCLKIF